MVEKETHLLEERLVRTPIQPEQARWVSSNDLHGLLEPL